ncbi:MAG: hypothetical protein IPH22_08180 [Nitrosomonas sp.]|nr:hypothetical protein [Nitrosomonas sp.]
MSRSSAQVELATGRILGAEASLAGIILSGAWLPFYIHSHTGAKRKYQRTDATDAGKEQMHVVPGVSAV